MQWITEVKVYNPPPIIERAAPVVASAQREMPPVLAEAADYTRDKGVVDPALKANGV